jgi:tetratricopeptide (TPR) repeat protein
VRALGASRGTRANERLRDAAHAFERERYEEARKLLKPFAEQAPQALAVRELLGLTYYRLGRWKDAARELEAFRAGSDSTEQHPVLADTYRALKRHREVEALWDELREASPSADLVAEGRIVMAGSLADRDDLAGAIACLGRHRRHRRDQRCTTCARPTCSPTSTSERRRGPGPRALPGIASHEPRVRRCGRAGRIARLTSADLQAAAARRQHRSVGWTTDRRRLARSVLGVQRPVNRSAMSDRREETR